LIGSYLCERFVVQLREDSLKVHLDLLSLGLVDRIISILPEGICEHLPEINTQLESSLVLTLLEVEIN
jgi:hypothetical protein